MFSRLGQWVLLFVSIGLLLILVQLTLWPLLPQWTRVLLAPFVLPMAAAARSFEVFVGDPIGRFPFLLAVVISCYAVVGLLFGLVSVIVGRRAFFALGVILLIAPIIGMGGLWSQTTQHLRHTDFRLVHHDGFAMPVWVRGDDSSDMILLHIHGGPGDSAMRMSANEAYRQLEGRYLVAYWEQPGSGNAMWRGHRGPVDLDAIVMGLDSVIGDLATAYPNKRIILLGHSFGGEVGIVYLIQHAPDNAVAAWIMVDGAHNEPLNWDLSVDWLENRAVSELAQADEFDPEVLAFWREALGYATSKQGQPREAWNESLLWSYYMEGAGGYDYGNARAPILLGIPQYVVGRQSYLLERFNLWRADFTDVLTADHTEAMSAIRVPTLILWGRDDGAVPVDLATGAFNALGTPIEDKSIAIIDEAAHNPMLEQPELYVAAVATFIDRLD